MPPLVPGVALWGISNLFETCDAGKIFATDNLDNLYELDPDLGTINLLRHYDMFGTMDINGMAATTEYLASACDHEFENIDCSTAVKDMDAASASVHIYPNPAVEDMTIDCKEKINLVDVADISGRILKRYSSPLNQIDVSDLPGGIYFLQIYFGERVVNKRIIVR